MNKPKVKIKEGSWIARIGARRLGFDRVALVIGHTVYLHNTTRAQFFARPSWVRHELKHVEQYERYGLIVFLWRYAIESWKQGYWQNALEIEARAAEADEEILFRYDLGSH